MQTLAFELHKLGWRAFEDLVGCILKETLGQTVQTFADGADGGRDGAFHGTWTPNGGETLSGNFTIQCKHSGKPGISLSSAIVSEELPKVTRLAAQGLADAYLLFTNNSLPAGAAAKIEEEIRQAGAKQARVFGAEWINHAIATNPTLRRLVPRLYGLGDLTQIITNQAYQQARSVLDSLSEELACFVPTEAYKKCAHALKECGFVILIGEPASGKTMIANLMALSAADEWNLQTLILNTPEDIEKRWNPDDPAQFFWVDDAFGANQYDPRRVQEWNQRLPQLRAAIHKGTRVVFTSRTYIFKSAEKQLNTHKFEMFNESSVIIKVEELSELERSMILYNHLRLGKQPKAFLSEIKGCLDNAIATPKFLPEIARRFSIPKFTGKLVRSKEGVGEFFAKPMSVMEDTIRGLAHAEGAAIALVFVNGGNLPVGLTENDASSLGTIAAMGSDIGSVKAALPTLEDSLLRKATVDTKQYWQFRHPTIRDAFASIVGSNPELVDIYVSGANKDRLISEVSCGDMDIEGVKVIVPSSLFDRVLEIIAPGGRASGLVDPVVPFLAKKCSLEFVLLYLNDANLIAALPALMHSPYEFDSALTLIQRLKAVGRLPEEVRLATVERIRLLADPYYWHGFVDGDLIGTLVTEAENKKLLSEQKDVIYSSQLEIINDIEASWDVDDDPEDAYIDVRRLVKRFYDGNEIQSSLPSYDAAEAEVAQKFISAIDENILSMKSRQSDATTYEELETEETPVGIVASGRSIFDDLDD